MAFISRFQFYFYETRSGSQSLRMQFFRSDPLDVIDLVLMAYNAGVINHTPLFDGKTFLLKPNHRYPSPSPPSIVKWELTSE